MKQKFTFLAMAIATTLFLVSCSTTSHTINGVNMNGTYVLNNVSFAGIDSGSITTEEAGKNTATIIHNVKLNSLLFDDAAPDCFRGSVWTLPHNGYGNYTISNGAECGPGQRSIIWSVRTDENKQKIFQLKILNGAKAKTVTTGYLLDITNLTQSGFSLTEPISVNGQTASVTLDFVRQ